jgi:hypothetical protein
MHKNVLTIGYEVPGRSKDYIEFTSRISLMDGDIVLFSTDSPHDYYESFNGLPSISDSGSAQYKNATRHWNKELGDFLKAGKTVFLLLEEKESFYLKTGTREFKGKMTINHVGLHDNYEFLPVSIGTINSAKGKGIEFTGDANFTDFYKSFKSSLEYEVYLENVGSARVIFTGKDKSKILGAVHKVGAGYLVTLPHVNYDRDKFLKTKKSKNGKESTVWSAEAMAFGYSLVEALIKIDSNLRTSSGKTPPPDWVSRPEFISATESKYDKEIKEKLGGIKLIESEISQLRESLMEEQKLKDLLFEQGTPLELAVREALKILGYEAEGYDDGELELDQVIVSPEGDRYIGECEGKDNKDIDITKFRQLLESLNADFAREDIQEKAYGILFGNPQRFIEPSERTLDFTQKCKTGASREKIALIRTQDLFKVVTYLRENPDVDFQKKCRKSIRDGLETIIKFPPLPNEK